MTELDDRIVRGRACAISARGPTCRSRSSTCDARRRRFSVFELMPLVRNLRQLTTKSRPLRRHRSHADERGDGDQDSQPVVDKARLDLVRRRRCRPCAHDLAAFAADARAARSPTSPTGAPRSSPTSTPTSTDRRGAARAGRDVRRAAGRMGLRLRLPAPHVRRDPRSSARDSWNAGTRLVEFQAQLADARAPPPPTRSGSRSLAQAERAISTAITVAAAGDAGAPSRPSRRREAAGVRRQAAAVRRGRRTRTRRRCRACWPT